MRKQQRRKKKSNTGRISFLCIGIFLVLVLSVQMVRLYQKEQGYVQREEALSMEKKELEKEQEALSEYEQYIQSQEYVEDTAKKKLGLIYEDEIIFREK